MRKIYKYVLIDRNGVYDIVHIPKNGIVLTALLQDNLLCIWALVNPEAPSILRKFEVYETGWPIKENNLEYINTAFVGGLVFHVFENLGDE